MPRLDPQPDDALLERIRSLERRVTELYSVSRGRPLTIVAANASTQSFAANTTLLINPGTVIETHGVVNGSQVAIPFPGLYLLHVLVVAEFDSVFYLGPAALGGTGTIGGIEETRVYISVGALPLSENFAFAAAFPVTQSDIDNDGPFGFLLRSPNSGSLFDFRAVLIRIGDLPDLR